MGHIPQAYSKERHWPSTSRVEQFQPAENTDKPGSVNRTLNVAGKNIHVGSLVYQPMAFQKVAWRLDITVFESQSVECVQFAIPGQHTGIIT
jgi:hypothetical protein